MTAKKIAPKKTSTKKAAKAAKTATGSPQAAQKGRKAKGSATKPTTKKKAATAKQGANQAEPKTPRQGSKKAQVLEMMRRPDGAGLKEIMEATGWQPHTVRGFMAGTLKKMGLKVESFKRGDERSYRLPQ
jgi:transglutaminase/protease-like cytokinesis protein 3